MDELESKKFSPAQRKCYEKMIKATFRDEMPRHEMLAVAAYVVGQILYFQDQQLIPMELAEQIIASNIAKGGKAAGRAMKDAA